MLRKTQVVNLGNIPGIGALILLVTWFIWLFTRQNQYVWNTDWDPQPSSNTEQTAEG